MRRVCIALLAAVLTACATLAATPRQAVLVQQADLRYVGAFRPPAAFDTRYDHSGHGLAYNPASNSLFMANYAKQVAEFSVVTPTTSSYPQAQLRQGPTDVLRGKLGQAGNMIGGLLVDGDQLIVSAYLLYDAATPSARLSHFRVSTDFAQTTVRGPVSVGGRGAGWVGGNMAHVPAGWQALLGGRALTGQSGISIQSRSSFGPTATVFDPAAIDAAPVPGTLLYGYDNNHKTLGDWNSSGTLWNVTANTPGLAWIEGTDSILVIGRKGLGDFCYGFCNDPTSPHKGDHSYPYGYFVWAYNAHDLLAVRQGQQQPWEVVPYATWEITDITNPTDHALIRGVAYDPASQRLFLSEQKVGGSVLIRVLQVGVPTSPAPPPPAPSPVDCAFTWPPDWQWEATDPDREYQDPIITAPEAHGGLACPTRQYRDVADSDGDGVHDRLDQCGATPEGFPVDALGCPLPAPAPPPVPDYTAEIAAVTAAGAALASARTALAGARTALDASVRSAGQETADLQTLAALSLAWADVLGRMAELIDAQAALLDAETAYEQAVAALIAAAGGGG